MLLTRAVFLTGFNSELIIELFRILNNKAEIWNIKDSYKAAAGKYLIYSTGSCNK